MVSPNVVKRIPIAIGIKPDQPTTFTNKTIDFASGTGNVITNVPTSALQYNTISINGTAIPLGGSISIQAQGGDPIVDTDTTYTFNTSDITGGANLDLTAGGSGVGTQTVKISGGGNVTVSRQGDGSILISDGGTLGGVSITDSSTSTLTNKTIDADNNTLQNIPNSALTNSFITINGSQIQLGGSVTIQGGGGFGDVTASSTTTFTNKTISGSSNTLSEIPNSALVNDSISINGTPVELGTNFNVSGLGDVTLSGEQTLLNKSLLNPVVQDIELIGTVSVGQGNGADPGTNGQLLISTGSGVDWANQGSIVAGSIAGALTIGAGLSSTGTTTYNGSNGITISVDTTSIANLTGTQTLTNKTLSAPNLTGDLQIDGVSGANGQVIVSDGAGGLAWGSGGGGGGSGSFNGPASSTDNAITRYDGTTGALAQDSLVTIDDTGLISAPSVASVIPFYHSSNLVFPSASTVNGAVAVAAANNSLYFASNGNWTRVATESEAAIQSRQTFSTTTGSLANNGVAYPNITAFKSYLLLKIEVDRAAWVTVYTSSAARSADTTRDIDVDPTPGSGVLAEIITTGAQTQVLTPAVIGFNDDSTPVNTIYLKVVNRSGTTGTVTVDLTALKLEA